MTQKAKRLEHGRTRPATALIRGWQQTLASIEASELSSDEVVGVRAQLWAAFDQVDAATYSPEWDVAEVRMLLGVLEKVAKLVYRGNG